MLNGQDKSLRKPSVSMLNGKEKTLRKVSVSMLNGQDKITKKSFSVDAERSGQNH